MDWNKVMPCAAALVFLSLLEVALIIAGYVPPVFSYSFANIAFSFSRLAVIAYCGYVNSRHGPLHCAKCGAYISLVYSLVFCAASALALLLHIPVLGMPYTGVETYAFVLAMLVVQNVALGAVVATGTAALGGAFNRQNWAARENRGQKKY